MTTRNIAAKRSFKSEAVSYYCYHYWTNINETSGPMTDRKKADAAEDKRNYTRPKSFIYDLCILGPIDVVGDIEVLMDLDKFFYTATCAENCELLHLEYGAFDSFFNRRHRDSRQRLCDRTKLKIEQQLRRMPPGAVPLMTSVRLRLEKTKSQLMQAKRRLKGKDLVPVRKIVDLPRGPIINNYGPGGLFYIIALQNRHVWEAAAEREMAQRHEASYKQVSLQLEEIGLSQRRTLTALSTAFKLKREDSTLGSWFKPSEMFDTINEVIFDWYETLEEELQIPFGKCNLVLEGPEPPQFWM
ncbi:Hypothetical predicted protein [Octopus vulgaris]|uniref:Uncharacterized protein n=1 Tax=Octopus vulgaris TaxID=6645 RepID=A0AA36F5W8_OCTVU|nr:Hypothetical predicted protein [Octopus vulgaris]